MVGSIIEGRQDVVMRQVCECAYLTLKSLIVFALIFIDQLEGDQLLCENILSEINVRHASTCNATLQAIVSYACRCLEYLHDVYPFVMYAFQKEHDQAG